jgi:hypothetical protein
VPEVRSRAEPKNHPAERRADVRRFFDPATAESVRLSLARRYDVRYVVAESHGAGSAEVVRQLAGDAGFRRVGTVRGRPGTVYTVFERI